MRNKCFKKWLTCNVKDSTPQEIKNLLRKAYYRGWGDREDEVTEYKYRLSNLKTANEDLSFCLEALKIPTEQRKNRVKKIYEHAVTHWTSPDDWFDMMGKILSEEA